MKPRQTAAEKNYAQLFKLSREARVLEGIHNVLSWDQETYMPPAGAGIRAEQLSLLAGMMHKQMTGKPFANALSKLIDLKSGKILAKGLSDKQHAALREWRKEYVKKVSLPVSFVEEFAKLTAQAVEVWRVAKQENAFQKFAPYLERIIVMNRKQADLLGYQEHPYDALLDLFEDGATTRELTLLFSRLKKSIGPLVKQITAAKPIDNSFLFGNFPAKAQMEFGEKILIAMGCDKEHGRLDTSAHPCSFASHPMDSRVTTNIHPTSLMSSISAVLHEGGHSLYERNLPVEEYGSPLGNALSYGMHESQSRWWEIRIGQSKPFWKHFLPPLQAAFKGGLQKVSLEDFYKAINKIHISPIRLEADELTYSFHIIARFELERDLIEGKLTVRDLPDAWKQKIGEYLVTSPKNNTEGCLQDIHWSIGAFGYFPSYILGNMYAAHLFEGFVKKHPDWEQRVAKGELLFITEWLKKAVHVYGKEYSCKDLLKKATGKTFSEKAYVDYLNTKYKDIYRL